MAIYDKYYQDENYFGESYKELVQFFKDYPHKGTMLDLGCGQGRDSIELARLGYKVTGVDISSVGIHQMLTIAGKENLDVKGLVEDIYSFEKIEEYDIIILDSMFHFYKNDKVKETTFLNKILTDMSNGSIFCNLLMQSKTKENYLKAQINKHADNFEIINDSYATYPEANVDYHMYIVRKTL